MKPFRDRSTIGAVTYGLSSFVGRDIEFEGTDVPRAINTVAGFAAYLIDRGSVIRDGATIGASAAERIKVRYKTSRRFANLPLLLTTAPTV